MPSRLPRRPPALQELLERCGGLQETLSLLSLVASAAESDRYLHWDELRHRSPPQGLSHEQWWLAEKLTRRPTPLPLLASDHQPFWFSQPPVLLQGLHQIDMQAGINAVAPQRLLGPCGSGLQAATDTGTSNVAMAQSSSRFRLAIRAEQVARNGESDFWMTPQARASSTLSYSWVSLLRKLMIRGA